MDQLLLSSFGPLPAMVTDGTDVMCVAVTYLSENSFAIWVPILDATAILIRCRKMCFVLTHSCLKFRGSVVLKQAEIRFIIPLLKDYCSMVAVCNLIQFTQVCTLLLDLGQVLLF